ncbi:PucR family transcriptional regulator [uncultured Microbacterium sp.]|uniref:PucR family transcriptional regulator n=1 Tax=uncultured Microbacterium sp. TaxID=191216 RepID=UPI0028D412E5|nr:PucR family transcriptional regulator [uncultured Microbacterium sp.]
MPTVADLIGLPSLRLQLLGGADGLDTSIEWASPSDLPTPWDWMSPGDLLLKNGNTVPRAARAQSRFLERLAAIGAAGLLIGLDPETPPIADAIVDASDRLGFPLITTEFSTTFTAISRVVAGGARADVSRRLRSTERIYDALRATTSQNLDVRLLDQLTSELGCSLAVLDAQSGIVLLKGADDIPDAIRDGAVSETRRRHGSLPGIVRLSGSETPGVVVGVPGEVMSVLIAFGYEVQAPDILLLQHAATAVGVLLSRQQMRMEHDRRVGGELLGQLFDREPRAGDEEALADRDLLQPDVALLAICAAPPHNDKSLHIDFERRGIPFLILRRGDILYALMPANAEVVGVLFDRLGTNVSIGISDPLHHASRLSTAYREATWSASVAQNSVDRVARYSNSPTLFALRDPVEAAVVVRRFLGKLLDYDAEHDADLVRTLDVFLRTRRSWTQTAVHLDIHRQTVVYRIARIAQVTGLDPMDSESVAMFWLALRARELSPPRPGVS